jgi:hypothetical protein
MRVRKEFYKNFKFLLDIFDICRIYSIEVELNEYRYAKVKVRNALIYYNPMRILI